MSVGIRTPCSNEKQGMQTTWKLDMMEVPQNHKKPRQKWQNPDTKMDKRPMLSASIAQNWESQLPLVDNRWRKWWTSLFLAVSSPEMGTQSEMSSATSERHLLHYKNFIQSGIYLPSPCRLQCSSWPRLLCWWWPTCANLVRWQPHHSNVVLFHLQCLCCVFKITYRKHVMNVEWYRCANARDHHFLTNGCLRRRCSGGLLKVNENKEYRKSPSEELLEWISKQSTFHRLRPESPLCIETVEECLSPYTPNGDSGIKVKVRFYISCCFCILPRSLRCNGKMEVQIQWFAEK